MTRASAGTGAAPRTRRGAGAVSKPTLPNPPKAGRPAPPPPAHPAHPASSLDAWIADLLKVAPPKVNQKLYAYLAPTNLPRLECRLKRLKSLRAMTFKGPNAKKKRGQVAHAVGKQFEHLIRGILQDCTALRYIQNLHTGTAEIDFLIGVEPIGFRCVPMLVESGNHVIGEAKCYISAPKSEWVNEFSGILKTHSAKTGILFVSCTPRTLGSAIRQNIALHAMTGQRIVPFGLTQIEEIRRGSSFLEVLVNQYTLAAVHGTSLSV